MADYDLFKVSGTKSVQSLDCMFVVEAKVDCSEQSLTQNDTFKLFDLPANTAVLGVLLYGKGENEGTARNVDIGTSDDSDAILSGEDLKAEDINIYKAGEGVYFDEETTIQLKAASDATYDTLDARVALLCASM